MKILTCKQRSPEWYAARLGKPTASNFDRILTPKTLERSSQSRTYLYELVAEWMTGIPHGSDASSVFMERGTQLEPSAARWYEYEYGVDTQEVGCVLNDAETAACSPDRLVGAEGGLEIKCPAASTHVKYLVEGLHGYTSQVQGCLWLTGRAWWDLVAWHPEMPSVVVRIERNERYIAALESAVGEFCAELQSVRASLESRGCVPAGLRLTPTMVGADFEPF